MLVKATRLIDISLSLPALLVTAPLIAAAGALVRATSPGPAFFRQERVGKDRRPFTLFKLRSMTGPQGDTRTTPVGRILRASKLDELPQLWNVVLGDMSLVGPRPEIPQFVAGYPPEWERTLSVRPGITGTASIAFRNEEALLTLASDRHAAYRRIILPRKMGVMMEDIDDQSIGHYFRVIARTATAMLGLVPPHPEFDRAREELQKSRD